MLIYFFKKSIKNNFNHILKINLRKHTLLNTKIFQNFYLKIKGQIKNYLSKISQKFYKKAKKNQAK